MDPIPFEQFRDSLQPVGAVATINVSLRASIQEAADALSALSQVNRESLAGLIREHPAWVPVLALCCRLSQEKLKSALQHGLKNAVEELVRLLGLPYEMRVEFVGRGGRTAPADVAIPAGRGRSEIVIGI